MDEWWQIEGQDTRFEFLDEAVKRAHLIAENSGAQVRVIHSRIVRTLQWQVVEHDHEKNAIRETKEAANKFVAGYVKAISESAIRGSD